MNSTERAEAALMAVGWENNAPEEAIADLITDLMHLAELRLVDDAEEDVETVMERAWNCYRYDKVVSE